MSRKSFKPVFGHSAGVLLAASLAVLGGAGPALAEAHDHGAHHHPHPVPAGKLRSVVSYTVPDVTLTAMDGRKVSLRAELEAATPLMMNFIFTTCATVCPVMSATFSRVQEEIGAGGDRVRLVSISIDPEYDTPARLKEYARKYRAGREWRFLTGSPADAVAVQRAFDAYRGGKMNHVPLTLLRASPDSPWVRIEGFASAEELVGEYRKLKRR